MRVSENFKNTLEKARNEYAKVLNVDRRKISYTMLTDKIAKEWRPKIKPTLSKINEKIENFMDSLIEE